MVQQEAAELSKQIVELNLLRDELLEMFSQMSGDQANGFVRRIQNS
jgi:hypothetical protein